LIDETLLAWLGDPSSLEDDGIDPPTGTIIRLSIDLAEHYRDRGFAAPNSIVADVNGGIVFERREGAVTEVIHIWEDGEIGYMLFDGTCLIERNSMFCA
jgi:hypothetical protein